MPPEIPNAELTTNLKDKFSYAGADYMNMRSIIQAVAAAKSIYVGDTKGAQEYLDWKYPEDPCDPEGVTKILAKMDKIPMESNQHEQWDEHWEGEVYQQIFLDMIAQEPKLVETLGELPSSIMGVVYCIRSTISGTGYYKDQPGHKLRNQFREQRIQNRLGEYIFQMIQGYQKGNEKNGKEKWMEGVQLELAQPSLHRRW